MKVNKNKFLSNIVAAALLSMPTFLIATPAPVTDSFTVTAQVTPAFGLFCGGSTTACALSAADFGQNQPSYYTTAHSIYYKTTIGTNLAQGNGTDPGVYYKITDTNTTTGAQPCGDGASSNCFLMNGTTPANHLPFQIGYQACGQSGVVPFAPGGPIVTLSLSESSTSGASGACTGTALNTSGTANPGAAPTAAVAYGELQLTIPAQTVAAPAPDTYSDTVTVTVCTQGDPTCV